MANDENEGCPLFANKAKLDGRPELPDNGIQPVILMPDATDDDEIKLMRILVQCHSH